jgi:hypothetical protein
LRSKITINEHRPFLAGFPRSIAYEPSLLCLATSITGDWCLHRECGFSFRATTTLSHGTLALIVLVDFHATAFLSRNRGGWCVVPGSEWPALPEAKPNGGTALGRAFLCFLCDERLLAVANEGITMAFGKSARSSANRTRCSRIHRRDERKWRLALNRIPVFDG